ncbi:ice-binding family protein [Micromonospora sp. NPDC051925]|uniref:ice-binding family protein n=1 Tax=Micromonospora sp. NPDC051925 TaxID=3364288 RepID=UPI0037CBB64B
MVTRRRRTAVGRLSTALLLACVTTLLVDVVAPVSARAETVPVPLGSAADFAILASTTVTNTGSSVVTGDVGVSPGTSVTGFPPGQINGAVHVNDGPAAQAQTDLTIAYDNAVARTTTDTISGDLGGSTRTTGVYSSVGGTFGIAGTLTLYAGGVVSANLGSVTVTDDRLLSAAAWTATVVATDFVTTGSPVRTDQRLRAPRPSYSPEPQQAVPTGPTRGLTAAESATKIYKYRCYR